MAIGTPTLHATDSRGFNTDDLVAASFTSAADEFLILGFLCQGSSAVTPDSITTGHGTWVQIGSTEQAGSRFSISKYGCISSGATSAITLAESTTGAAGIYVAGFTGVDVSGTVANALTQVKQTNGYGTAVSVTFDSSVTKTTTSVMGLDGETFTFDNTELHQEQFPYDDSIGAEYLAAGDDSPSATTAPTTWAVIAVELKEAAAGGTNVAASTDALVLTENSASVNAETSISASTDSLILTEQSATVALNVDVSAGTDTLTLTPFAASVKIDTNVLAATDSLTLTTFTASTGAATNVEASVDNLTLTEQQASVNAATNVDTNIDSLTLTENQATVTLGVQVSASTANLTLTELQAVIKKDRNVLASKDTLTLTQYGATVVASAPDFTIDGSATKVISTAYGALKMYGNGENWFTI